MERLTISSNGMVWMDPHENPIVYLEPCEMNSHHARMVLERLSGYEDTGLDPKEIISISKELDDCRNELCYMCGKYKERHLGACNGCRWSEKT